MVLYKEKMVEEDDGVFTNLKKNLDAKYKPTDEERAAQIRKQAKEQSKMKAEKKTKDEKAFATKIDVNIAKAVDSYNKVRGNQKEALAQRDKFIKGNYDKSRVMDNLVKVQGSNPSGLDKPSIKSLVKSQFPKQAEDYEKFKGDVVEWGVLSNIFAKMPKGSPVPKELEIRANKVGMTPADYQNNLIRSYSNTIMDNAPSILKGGVDIAKNFMKRLGQADPEGGFGGYAKEALAKEETSRLTKMQEEQTAYDRSQTEQEREYRANRDKVEDAYKESRDAIRDANDKAKIELDEKEYKLRKKQTGIAFVDNLMTQLVNLGEDVTLADVGTYFEYFDNDMKDTEIILKELDDPKQLKTLYSKAKKYAGDDEAKFIKYISKFGTEFKLTPLLADMSNRWYQDKQGSFSSTPKNKGIKHVEFGTGKVTYKPREKSKTKAKPVTYSSGIGGGYDVF